MIRTSSSFMQMKRYDVDIVCSKEKIRQEKYFAIEHNA